MDKERKAVVFASLAIASIMLLPLAFSQISGAIATPRGFWAMAKGAGIGALGGAITGAATGGIGAAHGAIIGAVGGAYRLIFSIRENPSFFLFSLERQ